MSTASSSVILGDAGKAKTESTEREAYSEPGKATATSHRLFSTDSSTLIVTGFEDAQNLTNPATETTSKTVTEDSVNDNDTEGEEDCEDSSRSLPEDNHSPSRVESLAGSRERQTWTKAGEVSARETTVHSEDDPDSYAYAGAKQCGASKLTLINMFPTTLLAASAAKALIDQEEWEEYFRNADGRSPAFDDAPRRMRAFCPRLKRGRALADEEYESDCHSDSCSEYGEEKETLEKEIPALSPKELEDIRSSLESILDKWSEPTVIPYKSIELVLAHIDKSQCGSDVFSAVMNDTRSRRLLLVLAKRRKRARRYSKLNELHGIARNILDKSSEESCGKADVFVKRPKAKRQRVQL